MPLNLYELSVGLDEIAIHEQKNLTQEDYLAIIHASTILYKLARMGELPPVGANKEVP